MLYKSKKNDGVTDLSTLPNKWGDISKKSLEILLYLRDYKGATKPTCSQIAKTLQRQKSTISGHLEKLRTLNLINKNNELTEEGESLSEFLSPIGFYRTPLIRFHKIQISFIADTIPPLHKTYTNFTPFTAKRYKALKGTLKKCSIVIYPSRKIVVNLPDLIVTADNIDSIHSHIDDKIREIKKGLKQELQVKTHETTTHHYQSLHAAILNSQIAKAHLLQYKSQRIDSVTIDNSHGIPELELETLHPDHKGIEKGLEKLVKYETLMRKYNSAREKIKELKHKLKQEREKWKNS